MKYTYKGALSSVLKLLAVSMFSIFLVACSSSTTEGLPGGDFDPTDDNDDGFNEGGEDEFADVDNNGVADSDEDALCKGQGGSDEESNNNDWSDNCQLRAKVTLNEQEYNHPFYNSTYAEGVQRILYCSGAAGTASSIEAFSDGIFGANTEEAVRVFQQNQNDEVAAIIAAGGTDSRTNLVVDGIVGPNTWKRMQSRVEDAYISTEVVGINNYDIYGVAPSAAAVTAGIDCSDQKNFLGLITDQTDPVINSWDMTDVPGGSGAKNFSISR